MLLLIFFRSHRTDVDECADGVCQNSGVCTNSVGSYSCDCTGTGYEGTDCDTGKYISVLMVYVRIVECVPTVWALTPL